MVEAFMGNFLRARPERAFCHICLSKMLDITFQDALSAIERLGGVESFNVSAGECSNCEQHRVVARFIPSS